MDYTKILIEMMDLYKQIKNNMKKLQHYKKVVFNPSTTYHFALLQNNKDKALIYNSYVTFCNDNIVKLEQLIEEDNKKLQKLKDDYEQYEKYEQENVNKSI